MKESNFIAADFGAGSGRLILGTLADEKISLKEIHRFKNKMIEKNNHIYWDFDYLFNELVHGLKKIAALNKENILGIGIDTWGVDYGLIDKKGNLLSNPFAYRDSRTDKIMDEVFKIVSPNEIYEKTGIQFLQFNTLFQIFASIKNNEGFLDKTDKLLFMPDLFNYYLTGKKESEYTIASTSQLLNAKNKEWDKTIFEKLNLPFNIMPKLVQPGNIIGKLIPKLQKSTGLNSVDVISVGSHDTASAISAVPVQQKNWAYLSSGTWSLIGIETPQPVINNISFEYGFTNETGVGNTNLFLKNVTGFWILEQAIKEWKETNENIGYEELLGKAESSSPFKFIIDPDDSSFLNPDSMLLAINNYCKKTKQSVPTSRGEYVRGILESMAFKYKFIFESINKLIDEPIEILYIVGGGSQNNLLNQFTSNALGIPVVVGPIEATAVGNILVQAISKNAIKNIHDGRNIIKNSFSLKKYYPVETEIWEKYYKKVRPLFV